MDTQPLNAVELITHRHIIHQPRSWFGDKNSSQSPSVETWTHNPWTQSSSSLTDTLYISQEVDLVIRTRNKNKVQSVETWTHNPWTNAVELITHRHIIHQPRSWFGDKNSSQSPSVETWTHNPWTQSSSSLTDTLYISQEVDLVIRTRHKNKVQSVETRTHNPWTQSSSSHTDTLYISQEVDLVIRTRHKNKVSQSKHGHTTLERSRAHHSQTHYTSAKKLIWW